MSKIDFGKAIPHDIVIKASSNNGYIVTVGCATFVAEDPSTLIAGLKQYLKDPKAAEKEMNEKAGTALAGGIDWGESKSVHRFFYPTWTR